MLNSHTHCQVAPANTHAKTWQRVCLFQRSTDRQSHERQKVSTQQRFGVMTGPALHMTVLW